MKFKQAAAAGIVALVAGCSTPAKQEDNQRTFTVDNNIISPDYQDFRKAIERDGWLKFLFRLGLRTQAEATTYKFGVGGYYDPDGELFEEEK